MKLRFLTLIWVVATFFLAGSILSYMIPQQPLSRPSNDATTKVLTVQAKLAHRMTQNKVVMTAHYQDMSSTLKNLSLSLNESTLVLSELKYQLRRLEEAQMPGFLNDLFNYLMVNRVELKALIDDGLSSIDQTLTLMIKEIDEMDLFLSQTLEELNGIEKAYLEDATRHGHSDIYTSNESKPTPCLSAGSLTFKEKEDLKAIFKHVIELDQVFPYGYAAIPSQNLAGATSHARFTTVLNSNLYNNYACRYSCNSTAQVKFAAIPKIDERVVFDWEDVTMDCTASDLSEAKHDIGTITYEKGVFDIWYEQP